LRARIHRIGETRWRRGQPGPVQSGHVRTSHPRARARNTGRMRLELTIAPTRKAVQSQVELHVKLQGGRCDEVDLAHAKGGRA